MFGSKHALYKTPMVPPQEDARSGSFRTTPWSLLFAALHGACPTTAQKALGRLCEIYWRPIYVFVRQSGYDVYDAQDLTQKFFVYLIEREAFAKADKVKGRFRAYVLGILKHFLIHAWRDERAQKRGGGAETVSLDDATSIEAERLQATRDHAGEPHAVDRQWALRIQRRVDDLIAGEYEAAGKSELYLVLRRHLTADKSTGRYKEDARRLGRSVGTVRSDVARMRKRYGELLLEELRKGDPKADLRQELFHYCRVIAL